MKFSEKALRFFLRMGARVFYGDGSQVDWIFEKIRRPRTAWLAARNMLNFKLRAPRLAGLITVGIEPVFGCNLRCAYCWGRFEPTLSGKREKLMSWELFTSVIDQLPASVETVTFGSVGEPLLHPRLIDMIEYAASKGRRVAMYTNGTLLYGEKAEQLARSPLSVLNVSMEPTEETARDFRGIDYGQVRKNIQAFSGMRRPGMDLQLSVVIHPGNQTLVERVHEEWRGIVDRVKVAPMIELNVQSCGVRESCSEIWRGNMNIQTNGVVSPCCLDVEGELAIGNLNKQPLREILDGGVFQDMMRGFCRGKVPPRCMRCTEYGGKGVPLKIPKLGKRTDRKPL